MNLKVWGPFETIKNHIILQTSSGKFLLSTGSPITIIKDGIILDLLDVFLPIRRRLENISKRLRKMSELYEVPDLSVSLMRDLNLSGRMLSEISDFIGTSIDGLIGTDYLMDIDVSIDPLSETFIFCPPVDKRAADFKGVMTDLEIYNSIPVVNLLYNGVEHRAFLDTGSCISYINESLIKGTQPVKKNIPDYLPMYGRFETDIYNLKIALASVELNMNFGVLPSRLACALNDTGIDFIIGVDILKNFAMHLSLSGKFIVLNKIELEPEGSAKRWIQKFNATPSYHLINNISLESIKDDFIGNDEIVKAIEERMLWLGEGSTREHLKKLLRRVRGEE
jgi:hypothetical protein